MWPLQLSKKRQSGRLLINRRAKVDAHRLMGSGAQLGARPPDLHSLPATEQGHSCRWLLATVRIPRQPLAQCTLLVAQIDAPLASNCDLPLSLRRWRMSPVSRVRTQVPGAFCRRYANNELLGAVSTSDLLVTIHLYFGERSVPRSLLWPLSVCQLQV